MRLDTTFSPEPSLLSADQSSPPHAPRSASGHPTAPADEAGGRGNLPHGGCPDCESTGVCEEHPFREALGAQGGAA